MFPQEPSHSDILHAEASRHPPGTERPFLWLGPSELTRPSLASLLPTPQKTELAAYPRCFSTALLALPLLFGSRLGLQA